MLKFISPYWCDSVSDSVDCNRRVSRWIKVCEWKQHSTGCWVGIRQKMWGKSPSTQLRDSVKWSKRGVNITLRSDWLWHKSNTSDTSDSRRSKRFLERIVVLRALILVLIGLKLIISHCISLAVLVEAGVGLIVGVSFVVAAAAVLRWEIHVVQNRCQLVVLLNMFDWSAFGCDRQFRNQWLCWLVQLLYFIVCNIIWIYLDINIYHHGVRIQKTFGPHINSYGII